MNTYSNDGFQSGALTSTAPQVVVCSNLTPGASVTLNSVAAGRLIEYSTDDGTNWQPATVNVTSTPQIIVQVNFRIYALRFTGAALDKYFIR